MDLYQLTLSHGDRHTATFVRRLVRPLRGCVLQPLYVSHAVFAG